MGFNLILALAGLASIPKDYYEWAAVEGMGRVRMFVKITVIYLVPTLFIMFVMSFINSFRIFRELYMLAGSYPIAIGKPLLPKSVIYLLVPIVLCF